MIESLLMRICFYRCGMVYIDPEDLKWFPYVKTWLTKFKKQMKEETFNYILELFETYIEDGLKFVTKKCLQAIHQVSGVSNGKIST